MSEGYKGEIPHVTWEDLAAAKPKASEDASLFLTAKDIEAAYEEVRLLRDFLEAMAHLGEAGDRPLSMPAKDWEALFLTAAWKAQTALQFMS
jgi:hypothetical protein